MGSGIARVTLHDLSLRETTAVVFGHHTYHEALNHRGPNLGGSGDIPAFGRQLAKDGEIAAWEGLELA